MDKLKNIVILFVFISTTFISRAQQVVSLDETVFLHANATTFVSGENLLYKIYCLKSSDKTPSNISKIAYVELLDDTKNIILKNKIILENATGQGDYFIPTTLKTGRYKLIAYTNWMLNKPISTFFQIDITIINPYKKPEKIAIDTVAMNSNTISLINKSEIHDRQITTSNIKFNLNKKTYKTRELVNLKIESVKKDFQNGNYSLSIRKSEDLPTIKPFTAVEFADSKEVIFIDVQEQKNKIQLPELRGEIISGFIKAKNNIDQVANKTIALSLPGENFIFKIVRTDSLGNFIFNINKVNYNADITIQMIDSQSESYNLELNNDPEIDSSKLIIPSNYSIPISFKNNLINRSINSQIENAYYSKKENKIEKTEEAYPFYHPLAKEYILDQYTRFNTLKETITEVTTELYSKRDGDKIVLHVNDPSVYPQLSEKALVLIDGLYLENQKELFEYKMKNIYKIEIIAGRYYLGSKFFNGLVSFTTLHNDFTSSQSGSSIIKKNILRPQPKTIYTKPDYSTNENQRIPDFRNQLLWNPDMNLNNTSNEIPFYTSDVNGIYEIKLEGFSKNGTPVSLVETIEVNE